MLQNETRERVAKLMAFMITTDSPGTPAWMAVNC
jgi:hypothetical protein